ncbi:MAG: hypothetical protein CMJ39_03045 [Phycisphaerae bacterium]|nr:hypothetical protein [Phycisphaerae bacterium]
MHGSLMGHELVICNQRGTTMTTLNFKQRGFAIALAATTSLMTSSALAENAPEWVSFDNSPAGTPPTITLLLDRSSPKLSTFDVRVHGLWLEDKTTDDGRVFQQLTLPGSGASTDALGLPELPAIPLNLAIPARNADLGFDKLTLEQVMLDQVNVVPAQPRDGEDRSDDEQDNSFYYNQDFYQQTNSPWPQEAGRLVGDMRSNRGIMTQTMTAQCVRSIPASKQAIIDTRFEFSIAHEGEAFEPMRMSRRFATRFDMNYHNALLWWHYELALLNMGANEGCYLIVTPTKYVDELMPLIRQKTERGLRVKIVTTESLGSGFDHVDVKAAISDWYDDCNSQGEAYVLLIGDVDEMPMHLDPVRELPSDHYYVCLEDDLYPSCEIGRYSVDSETDLSEQIAKTIKYSESPMLTSAHYERSLLAAHKQESKEYVECIEEIAAASYWGFNPSFKLYSGRSTDSLVSNVLNDISDTHYGLVMYRGHGWKLKWGDNWNVYNQELWDTDVETLTNGHYTPIVVAVACGNNAIDLEDDSIGETWMEGAENGGVAHIGSIRSSKTNPNHYFAKAFQNYYWCGYSLCIGEMMQDAWLTARMNSTTTSNADKNIYMSQLLGDPELRPWQQSPWSLVIEGIPNRINPGFNQVDLEIEFEEGMDPQDVLVSTIINGELFSLNRFNADGTLAFDLEVEADAEVVIRAFTELGGAQDSRFEIPIDLDDCPADLDGNGVVDVDDLLLVISAWDSPDADITGDDVTNIDDLLTILSSYGSCE